MAANPVLQHFFHGFVRLHILYHAAKEPVYGAEIREELVRHGYPLTQGTLYPTLHLLEKLKFLRSTTRVVQGRRRRYYEATPAGKAVLADARDKLKELVAEILEDQDEPFRTIQEKRGRPASEKGTKKRGKKG